jgi:cytochrome b
LHWVLAASFVGALAIALLVRHRDPRFPVHMLLGVVAALAIALRVIWGLVGSRYARFTSFALGPRAVLRHLTGRGERQTGHDPFASWGAVAMLASIAGVAVTGVMAVLGSRSARQLHPLFAYAALALVVVHVAGVVIHALRRRDAIALGMLDGKKLATAGDGIRSHHALVALVFAVLIGAAVRELVVHYDAQSRVLTLPRIGELRLGPGGSKRVAARTWNPGR